MDSFFKSLSILSIIFSIVALVFAIAAAITFQISPNYLSTVLNLIAVIVTSIGFVVGCYFASKAVEAYRQIKELEAHLKEAEKIKDELKAEIERISISRDEIFSDIANKISLLLLTGEILIIALSNSSSDIRGKEDKFKEIRKKIAQNRGTLFYIKQLSDEERIIALQLLVTFGNKIDLEKLQKVIDDPTENEKIRKQSKMAYELIQQRLVQESN